MKVNVEAPADLPQGFILSVKVDGISYNYKCDRDYKKGEKIQFDPDFDIVTETETRDEDPSEKITNTTTTSSLQSSYNAPPPTDIMTIQQQKEQLQQQQQVQQQVQARNQQHHHHHHGSFQYELCGCCDSNVCCTALWWNAYICCCIPFGQLLTRLNLNALGQQIRQSHQQAGGSSTFCIIVTLCIIFYVCPILLSLRQCDSSYTTDSYGNLYDVTKCSPTYGSTARTIFSILYTVVGIYLLIVLTCTRISFRRRFGIQGNGLCDFCTMYWCNCCAIIQMLRQTHNENEYHYECCNTTGLPNDAPPLPPV